MDREERVLAWLGFIFIAVSLGIQVLQWFDVIPQFLMPYSMVIVLGFAVAGVIFIIIAWKKGHQNLDYRFEHLTIHYSSQKDSPDSTVPDRPRFVSNNITKQVYWVSDLLEQYIRKHKISWHTHDNESTLRKYLRDQGFKVNEKDPFPEELELWLKPNGSLVLMGPKLDPEILEKLKKRKLEGKLKDYQIAFLYPWFCWFLRFDFIEKRVDPPSKRVIANTSTKEAFEAPKESWDLVCENLISSDNFTPRPWEDIPMWCKRKMGWEFSRRRFTVEELAGIYQ